MKNDCGKPTVCESVFLYIASSKQLLVVSIYISGEAGTTIIHSSFFIIH